MRPFGVTNHAIDRYRSRVCPDAPRSYVVQQLSHIAAAAPVEKKTRKGGLLRVAGDLRMITEGSTLITLYWTGS